MNACYDVHSDQGLVSRTYRSIYHISSLHKPRHDAQEACDERGKTQDLMSIVGRSLRQDKIAEQADDRNDTQDMY